MEPTTVNTNSLYSKVAEATCKPACSSAEVHCLGREESLSYNYLEILSPETFLCHLHKEDSLEITLPKSLTKQQITITLTQNHVRHRIMLQEAMAELQNEGQETV
jgi:hypothetical protein